MTGLLGCQGQSSRPSNTTLFTNVYCVNSLQLRTLFFKLWQKSTDKQTYTWYKTELSINEKIR